MKRFISMIMVVILVVGIFVGCQQKPKDQGPKENPGQDSGQEAKTIVDPAGNEIELPEKIDSVVSLGPSTTEVLVELGIKDKIVATDTYSADVEGLDAELAKIDMMNLDAEELIALKPDIVLATGMVKKGDDSDPLEQVGKAGITVVYIASSDTIEGIYNDIDFLGKLLAAEDKGKEIVDNLKDKIAEYKAIGDSIEDKKTVYFEIGSEPSLYSFGKGGFINDMIELVGGENIFASKEDSWLTVSEEEIINENPDVIITNETYLEDPTGAIKNRSGWDAIKAVKDDQVYTVNNNASSRPNQNIVIALEEIAKAIYPDKY